MFPLYTLSERWQNLHPVYYYFPLFAAERLAVSPLFFCLLDRDKEKEGAREGEDFPEKNPRRLNMFEPRRGEKKQNNIRTREEGRGRISFVIVDDWHICTRKCDEFIWYVTRNTCVITCTSSPLYVPRRQIKLYCVWIIECIRICTLFIQNFYITNNIIYTNTTSE